MNKISCLLILFFIAARRLYSSGIQDPITYSKNSQLQWDLAMDTIALISWSGSERVLDVGCGDGKVTAFLASKLTQGSVLGIDVSEKMIDFATSQHKYPNLIFEREDGAEISFENQFDCVVSFSTLHWILEQEKALKAFYRALIPGGKVCLQTYGKFPMGVTIIADHLVHSEKWATYFPFYKKQRIFFTEDEYSLLLKNVGFEDISINGSVGDTPFFNRQALIDFATPILDFILHLSEDLQKKFAEDVVDEIIDIAGMSSDGCIHYRDFNIRVIAKRPISP